LSSALPLSFVDSRSAQNWACGEGCAVPAAYRGR